MGAMRNDLERCTYMFSDDRRCRNLIHTPGSSFCFFHANRSSKKRKPASANSPADRSLFQWLATHPLDNVTNVNHAINLIALLLAGQRISVRRADALLRLLRVAMKSVPDVHEEYDGDWHRSHWTQGQRFLSEIQPLLASPAPPGSPVEPPPAPGPGHAPAPSPAQSASNAGSPPVAFSPPAPAKELAASRAATPASAAAAAAAGNGTPSVNPAPPARPARAAQPMALPHGNPLAPLVEKRLPSIIRALLSNADLGLFEPPQRPARSPAPETSTAMKPRDENHQKLEADGVLLNFGDVDSVEGIKP